MDYMLQLGLGSIVMEQGRTKTNPVALNSCCKITHIALLKWSDVIAYQFNWKSSFPNEFADTFNGSLKVLELPDLQLPPEKASLFSNNDLKDIV